MMEIYVYDAGGKGKGLTFFKVHQVGAKNEVRLESQKHDTKFLNMYQKIKHLLLVEMIIENQSLLFLEKINDSRYNIKIILVKYR